MHIYDGSNDKKSFPTNHTVAVVSCNRALPGEKDTMTVRKSGREDWSLFFCESGRMYFDDKMLTSGQLWIYPPSVMQKYWIYNKDKTIYRYLHFTGSDLTELFSSLDIDLQTPVAVKSNSFLTAFDNIQAAMYDESPLSKLKAEYNALYLITKIAKKQSQRSNFSMMKRVTDAMEHSFSSEYDADYFASLQGISVSRFNHLFKECLGQSPYSYYLKLRIDNAVNLLDTTNLKIKDVAQQCGFDDPLYFTQVFKRIQGVTPSKYRKTNGVIK